MEDRSRGWLFRKRNVLVAALVAGAIVGMYLPDFWKGFGGGSTVGVGIGDSTTGTGNAPSETGNSDSDNRPTKAPDAPNTTLPDNASDATNASAVIKVVIDEKSYFIRSKAGDRQVTIPEIIALIQAATGDIDGIRVRIYQKGTSRPSAENALNDAFQQAKISDTAVVWMPTIVK